MDKNITNVKETEEKECTEVLKIKAPIMILFAEYLGFVSKFVNAAEKWCKGEAYPNEWQKSLLETDAYVLYKSILENYDVEDVVMWYKDFYDLVFIEYDNNLKTTK